MKQPKSSAADAWALLCVAMTLYVISQVVLTRCSIVGGTALGQVLCFLVPSFLYARWKSSKPPQALRLCMVRRGVAWRVAMLALTGVGLTDLLDCAMRPVIARHFSDWIPGLQALMEVLTPKTAHGLAVDLCVIGILAPICEEVLFRGAFQGTLEQRGAVRAIGNSALMFGLLHLNPFNFFGPVLYGVALGFVTWRTQSLLPAILWHALHNSASVLVLYVGGPSAAMPLWLDAGLAVLFGLLAWEFIRYTRRDEAPQRSSLAGARVLIHGPAFRWVSVVGSAGVIVLVVGITCLGCVTLGDDLLAPDYRAGDLVIYRRGLAFRPDKLRARDVVIYRENKGALRYSRVLRAEGDQCAVVGLKGTRSEVVIQRKDVLGEAVWKLDPGEEVKHLMRQMRAVRPATPQGRTP